MYPDMYLEHLTRPNILSHLLASRVAAPAIFANQDLAALKVGLQLGAIKTKRVNGVTMYFGTATTPQNYDRVVDWINKVGAQDDYEGGNRYAPRERSPGS